MSSLIEMTDYEHLTYLKKSLDNHLRLKNLKTDQQKELEREKTVSAFKKAASLFFVPFKKEAFGTLFSVIITLFLSVLFGGCILPVLLAVIFCAIADFLCVILFALIYSFAVLYFAIFKGLRVKSIEKKIKNTEDKLKKCIKLDVLKEQIDIYEKKSTSSRGGYSSSVTGVENTEWYKKKADEYYRIYMGFPPKEEEGLSWLSTDTTLDIHPGDY